MKRRCPANIPWSVVVDGSSNACPPDSKTLEFGGFNKETRPNDFEPKPNLGPNSPRCKRGARPLQFCNQWLPNCDLRRWIKSTTHPLACPDRSTKSAPAVRKSVYLPSPLPAERSPKPKRAYLLEWIRINDPWEHTSRKNELASNPRRCPTPSDILPATIMTQLSMPNPRMERFYSAVNYGEVAIIDNRFAVWPVLAPATGNGTSPTVKTTKAENLSTHTSQPPFPPH